MDIPNNPWATKTGDVMEQSTMEAYERYVMAQFKFTEAAEFESERQSAIASLIPGTKHYYHLYFLDLVKKKKSYEQFDKDQKELYG